MTAEELHERKRLNYQRRLRAVSKQHSLPPLSNIRLRRLTTALAAMTGEGVSDADLRVLHKLTTRGLLDT
jgi:hypothetical protein